MNKSSKKEYDKKKYDLLFLYRSLKNQNLTNKEKYKKSLGFYTKEIK